MERQFDASGAKLSKYGKHGHGDRDEEPPAG
jgi:hypothetical protein